MKNSKRKAKMHAKDVHFHAASSALLSENTIKGFAEISNLLLKQINLKLQKEKNKS